MAKEQQISKQNELWNRLQNDLFKNFPENYKANVKLINDILTYKHIVHPTAVVSSYFTIVSGLTAESFYTHYNSSTTLYNICIAGTGTGKDMAIDLVPQIFSATKHKAHETKTDIGYEVITSKITSVGALDGIFKKKRMLVYVLDEFGDALGKMQGGGHAGELTAKFKELYSQTNKTYKSIVYARSNKHSADNITRDYPCFILTGLTTKAQLLTRLKRAMLHDGFLNRFVIMDGSDLKPYINNDFKYSENDQFKEAIEFYGKAKNYPNTPIELSNEAKEYYKVIGSPYEEGTDIYKFCIENEDEEFETNASIANRWRENALRLATAITAYEYGVNNTTADILKFQMESFERRKNQLKGTSLENFKGSKDYVSESIEDLKSYSNENPHYINKIIEGMEKHRDIYNEMLNEAHYKNKEDRIKSLVSQLKGDGSNNIKNTSIEDEEDALLSEALDKVFEGTTDMNKDIVLEHILKNKSKEAEDKINDLLSKKVKDLEEQNSTLLVEKDILEWTYNFIKEQSIKFYEIFHTEVGQSQYSIKKHKFLKWLKDHHDKQNPWHTMSELTKTYVFNKLCTAKEKKDILKELEDAGIIESQTQQSKGTHKPTIRYKLVKN